MDWYHGFITVYKLDLEHTFSGLRNAPWYLKMVCFYKDKPSENFRACVYLLLC